MSTDSAVTFAIISNAPAASALLQSVCDELSRQTTRAFKPIVLRSYDKLVHFMRDGDVQVAWAPPLVAIDLERETKAEIRLCSRRAGRADYMSALFVPRDAAVFSIEELKDKRVAWVAKESSAGYVVPRLKIASLGFDPKTFFSEESFRRTHEAVVRGVLKGEADVGATFASFEVVPGTDERKLVSSGWLEAGLKEDEVKVVATAGPIPSDVIAISRSLSPETAQTISDALRDLGTPMKLLLNAESFVEPEKSHFDALRQLVDSAASAEAAAVARAKQNGS